MKTHKYGDEFFRYIDTGSRRSAQVLVDVLRRLVPVRSVLDVGCGRGVWLAQWMEGGVLDVTGIDGDYLERSSLLVPAERFEARDLGLPFRLERRFDLVQSLEVAEHIVRERADTFVDNLVAHGDVILFSAAVPGQGGEFHVNEQPYEYWREKFIARGYRLLDAVRPAIRRSRSVEPWYRYNTFLFVQVARLATMPPHVAAAEISPPAAIPDVSGVMWRVRKRLLRGVSTTVISRVSMLKHWVANSVRRRR